MESTDNPYENKKDKDSENPYRRMSAASEGQSETESKKKKTKKKDKEKDEDGKDSIDKKKIKLLKAEVLKLREKIDKQDISYK